jgi:hypothetical protein
MSPDGSAIFFTNEDVEVSKIVNLISLCADDDNILTLHLDDAYADHEDYRCHSGAAKYLGSAVSTKQKGSTNAHQRKIYILSTMTFRLSLANYYFHILEVFIDILRAN